MKQKLLWMLLFSITLFSCSDSSEEQLPSGKEQLESEYTPKEGKVVTISLSEAEILYTTCLESSMQPRTSPKYDDVLMQVTASKEKTPVLFTLENGETTTQYIEQTYTYGNNWLVLISSTKRQDGLNRSMVADVNTGTVYHVPDNIDFQFTSITDLEANNHHRVTENSIYYFYKGEYYKVSFGKNNMLDISKELEKDRCREEDEPFYSFMPMPSVVVTKDNAILYQEPFLPTSPEPTYKLKLANGKIIDIDAALDVKGFKSDKLGTESFIQYYLPDSYGYFSDMDRQLYFAATFIDESVNKTSLAIYKINIGENTVSASKVLEEVYPFQLYWEGYKKTHDVGWYDIYVMRPVVNLSRGTVIIDAYHREMYATARYEFNPTENTMNLLSLENGEYGDKITPLAVQKIMKNYWLRDYSYNYKENTLLMVNKNNYSEKSIPIPLSKYVLKGYSASSQSDSVLCMVLELATGENGFIIVDCNDDTLSEFISLAITHQVDYTFISRQ